MPTRRKKKRPTHLDVLEGATPHGAPTRQVPVDEAPGAAFFPIYAPPGILLGEQPNSSYQVLGGAVYDTSGDGAKRQRALKAGGMSGALSTVSFESEPFFRTLAKIAHGYCVANVGLSTSDLLQPYILGHNPNIPYLVGGTPPGGPLPVMLDEPKGLHQVSAFPIAIDGVGYAAVQIQLFSHLKPPPPVYTVIARRHDHPAEKDHFRVDTTRSGRAGAV